MTKETCIVCGAIIPEGRQICHACDVCESEVVIERENAENLCNAVILQACKDYARALIQDDKKEIEDCEKFFRSKWYEYIETIGLSGEDIITKIKRGANKFVNKTNKTFSDGFISKKTEKKYRAFKCPICGGNVYSRYGFIGMNNFTRVQKIGYICKCNSCHIRIFKVDKKEIKKPKK